MFGLEFVDGWALAIWLTYHLPMYVCLAGYAMRTGRRIAQELRRRRELAEYRPQFFVRDIAGYLLVSVLPFANLLAMSLDVAPKLFCRLWRALARLLDRPLVPAKNPS
jgi:hypothetical protein